MKRPDPRQPSFTFDAPPPAPLPGSLDFGAEIRSALARAIKACPESRALIAARMNDLVYGELAGEGGEITVHMVNKWTAPAAEGWRFPLEYLPAFVEVTKAHWLLDVVAQRCGCVAMPSPEAALADIGALRARQDQLAREEAALASRIDPSAAERLLKRRANSDRGGRT